MKRMARQGGVALLVVLWGCTLAAITLGALASTARVESTQARGQVSRTQALYAAQAGIDRAVYMLNARDDSQRWMADGRRYAMSVGTAEVQLEIADEDGKVNLNTASPELIERLLLVSGVPPSSVAGIRGAILGWGRRGNMAASLLLAKGGFASLDELYRVPGVDAGTVDRVLPFLTLWNAGEPNLAHAPPTVVAAVTGASLERAQHYVEAVRRLPSADAALPLLPGTGSGSAAKGFSGVVSIVSRARLADGMTLVLDTTVVLHNAPGDPRAYRVLRWRERAIDSGS